VQLLAFTILAIAQRHRFGRVGLHGGLMMALAVGAADLLGVVSFSYGASQGFLSVVLIASAVFPLIAVVLSVGLLHERPAMNQYVGIGLTVLGLVVLGLS
jgi:drug/metabolite transporter (DMT)-like permease